MPQLNEEARRALDHLPTKSAKIRALDAHGLPRAEIARALGIRYQHVRNVLEDERARCAKPEAPAVTQESPSGEARPADGRPVRLHVQDDGKVVLPPDCLAGMELGPEREVTAHLVDGELRLVAPRVALRKLRTMARSLAPEGYSVVDEFIAEKRREAERE